MSFENMPSANSTEKKVDLAEKETGLNGDSGLMGRLNKKSRSLVLRASLLASVALSALHMEAKAGDRGDFDKEFENFKTEATSEFNKYNQDVEAEFNDFLESKKRSLEGFGNSKDAFDELDKEVDEYEKEKTERVENAKEELSVLVAMLGETEPETAEKYKNLSDLNDLDLLEKSVDNLKLLMSIDGEERNSDSEALPETGEEDNKENEKEDDSKVKTKFVSKIISGEEAREMAQKINTGVPELWKIGSEGGDNNEEKFLDKVEDIVDRKLDDIERRMWSHTYKNLADSKGDENIRLSKLTLSLRAALAQ